MRPTSPPTAALGKTQAALKEASYHLTLLAQNQIGFKNLIRLASAAYLEGFYFKPRIDRELLERVSRGHHLPQRLRLQRVQPAACSRASPPTAAHLEEAKQVAAWFHSVFGDRYFIEIQNNGLEIQRMQMEGAVEVAREMGLPLVATSDAHYVNREDSEAQDVLLVHQHRQVPHGHQPHADGHRSVLPSQPGRDARGISRL